MQCRVTGSRQGVINFSLFLILNTFNTKRNLIELLYSLSQKKRNALFLFQLNIIILSSSELFVSFFPLRDIKKLVKFKETVMIYKKFMENYNNRITTNYIQQQ